MRLVAFEPAHLDRLDFGEFERAVLELDGPIDPLRASLTLMSGDTPMACGGFIERADDVAEAWVVASDALRAHPLAMHRAALMVIGVAATTWKRLRAMSRKGYPTSQGWLERLGFEAVGEDDVFIHYERGAP